MRIKFADSISSEILKNIQTVTPLDTLQCSQTPPLPN